MKYKDGRYRDAALKAWARPGARAKRRTAMRTVTAQAKRRQALSDPNKLRLRAARLLERAAALELISALRAISDAAKIEMAYKKKKGHR